jgi:putative endonuclease
VDQERRAEILPTPRAGLGRLGEEMALAWYRSKGYRLVARNWRCGLGEIDLVLARGSLLAFCEVKTRRSGMFGGPHEAVTWKKRRKLRQLAETFLLMLGEQPQAVRFDVASVLAGREHPSVHVFEQAF